MPASRKDPAQDVVVGIEALLCVPAFSLPQREKVLRNLPALRALTAYHRERCGLYDTIVGRVFGDRADYPTIDSLPFIPVALFKHHDFVSVPQSEIIKIITSSGTSGHKASRLHYDSATAQVQRAAVLSVGRFFLGDEKMPTIVVDSLDTLRDRSTFTARALAILGMLQFSSQTLYALDSEMRLNIDALTAFVEAHKGRRVLLFGFTFIVWQHLVRELEKRGVSLSLDDFVLIHSGGWKRMEAERVSEAAFCARTTSVLGRGRCVNFYGMAELGGTVFFQNPTGAFHCPSYADVIIRHPSTLEPLPAGIPGLIQVVNTLPTSYPGHSILTEDMGMLVDEDGGRGGMMGRSFRVLGRVPMSELRGCSDTYAAKAGL
jgi:hypothetical protein